MLNLQRFLKTVTRRYKVVGISVEEIQKQIQNLEIQKLNHQGLFNQCVGAITILNEQLSIIKQKEEPKPEETPVTQGDENGAEMDSKDGDEEGCAS